MRRYPDRLASTLAVVMGAAALTAGCSDPLPAGGGDQVSVSTHAATVPSGFIDEVFATGFNTPTAMEFAPDGRLFVAEQGGRLLVVRNGVTLAAPFVSLTVNRSGERGLLGIAFDPAFAANNFVYLYYTTATGTIHNRVSRFTASGDVAVPGSETVIMDLDPLSSATNHNGGCIHFGSDGKLYVAVGENANGANAQTLSNRHGKMLRINADGTIPGDNPFFSMATGLNRSIWARGLRNPFTFIFQPGTGQMYINDVGETTWEEIDVGAAGANYGWPHAEGPTGNLAGDTAPLFSYRHLAGTCAITGGAFYNPPVAQFPSAWTGHYFFADFCAGWIHRLDPQTATASDFATGISSPVDLKVGADGALYYLARGTSNVGRIRAAATSQPPTITVQPASRTVSVGQPATFTVSASGTQPLTFQWQRNGIVIAGATSSSYTLAAASAADGGAQFRVVVSNVAGAVTSAAATLTVTTNRPPLGTIAGPPSDSLYTAGQTIAYSGTGSDPEDGGLPAGAFTWQVDFHHDTHVHPFLPATTGASSGSFVVPTSGETATNVWFEVILTVRDSGGLTHTSSVNVRPRTAALTLATTPAGLQVTLDGQPVTTPATIPSVVGMTRTLGAVTPQTQGTATFTFTSWSDGGASTHAVVVPASPTTYTAAFTSSGGGGGGGLRGEYFDNIDFTSLRLTRVDPTVNFNFGTGSPDPLIGVDTFSIRWTGSVTPAFSEPYTFFINTDDGVRLRVNGALVVDSFIDQPPTERAGTIALVAGQPVAIQMDYFENGGGAVAQLSWQSASQPKGIIPAARLSPPATGGGPTFPIRINFQLSTAAVPTGYLPDGGAVFGLRSGGLSYGWNVSHADVTRERNAAADQRVDTLCHFHAGGRWEIALPNGSYTVLVGIGDPSFASAHTLNVEGTSYWAALPLAANQFRTLSRSVTVADGRLTLDQGSAADKATRIDYLEITTP